MSPTKDLSFNSMYAAFGELPESRILSPELIGLTDDAVIQMRQLPPLEVLRSKAIINTFVLVC